MFTESVIATLVTGGIAIIAILVHKFKCLCVCSGCCRFDSCKFGFMDNSIVDEHNVEFKKICANGNDLIYVSKNVVHANDSDDEEFKTIPPTDFIPSNEKTTLNPIHE